MRFSPRRRLVPSPTAYARNVGTVRDSSQLAETRGTVRQYKLTPRGGLDGLILNDGTEVKLPAHLRADRVCDPAGRCSFDP
jgi:hypothetical protein